MNPPAIITERKENRGYTLIEVLAASALLGLAIGGAASLSATINVQHAAALSGAVAQNYHDNAAHLWQLGLSPAEVLAVMPHVSDNANLENAIVSTGTAPGSQVAFGVAGTTVLVNGMGTVENVPCTLTVRNPVGAADRTLTLQIYRPTIR